MSTSATRMVCQRENRDVSSLSPHSLADVDVGGPRTYHRSSMPIPSRRGGAALPVTGRKTPELSERNNA